MGKESHQSENAATHEVLSTVQDVDIDFEGRFKYILIRISIGNAFKHIVRGYARCGFHADVLEEVEPELKAKGLKVSCKGGGRIEHQYKKISVYGYSQVSARYSREKKE